MLPFSSLKAASPALAHPSQAPRRRDAHARGVQLRLRQHASAPRTPRRPTSATPSRRPGRIFYEAGLANFALHPPTDVHFKQRRPGAAADRRRRRRTTPSRRRSRARSTRSTRSRRRRPTTWSSRAARTCSSSARAGRRSPRRSTAGSTACSTRRAGRRLAPWTSSSAATSPSSPGASKGIGLAVVRALAAEGARGRRRRAHRRTRSPGWTASTPWPSTSPRPDGPEQLVARARSSATAGVDVLVNNVGGVQLRLDGFLAHERRGLRGVAAAQLLLRPARDARGGARHARRGRRRDRQRRLGQRVLPPRRPR